MKKSNEKKANNDSQHSDPEDPNLNPEVQEQILRALAGLGYGSVEITVHDSKVVQIERKEKIRFKKDSEGKGGKQTA